MKPEPGDIVVCVEMHQMEQRWPPETRSVEAGGLVVVSMADDSGRGEGWYVVYGLGDTHRNTTGRFRRATQDEEAAWRLGGG